MAAGDSTGQAGASRFARLHLHRTASGAIVAGLRLQGLTSRQLLVGQQDNPLVFLRTLLSRQTDLLEALAACAGQPAFDLRYAVEPGHGVVPGWLHVGLLWQVGGDGHGGEERAERVAEHLEDLLHATFDEYRFDRIACEDDMAWFFPEPAHMGELLRRESTQALCSATAAGAGAAARLGFARRGARAPEEPSAANAGGEVYLVHPFSPTLDTFARVARALLRASAPTVVSFRLQATHLEPIEVNGFVELVRGLEEARGQAASAASGRGGPVLRRVEEVSDVVSAQVSRLQDTPLAFRVQVASGAPVPASLMQVLGASVTCPAADVASPMRLPVLEDRRAAHLAGGFAWEVLEGQALAAGRTAFAEVRCDGSSSALAPPGLARWRHLIGPGEAIAFFRLPIVDESGFPGLDILESRVRPASEDVPTDGLVLGISGSGGAERPAAVTVDDRRRHIYAVGQTGTGKTTFFEGLILQDIRAGRGACVLDPHGDLVERLLGKIPPDRMDDVIYFDPADTERPHGLNLLQWETPEERQFLIGELLSILVQLAQNPDFAGPVFHHYAQNMAWTVMSNRKEPGTLVDLVQLYVDPASRKWWMPHVDDPMVELFWTREWDKTSDFHRSETMGYFISKFSPLVSNPLMRNILGQQWSSIDFTEAMNKGRVILVNLAKGRLGETASRVLGMVVVARIAAAAMKRVALPESERRDFCLYVDEFHNLATMGFSALLAEARKFHLSLVLTHQFVAQLNGAAWGRHMRGVVERSVLGNVGTVVAFRCGPEDAASLESIFAPSFVPGDLINLPNFRACVSGLVDGVKVRPYTIDTVMDRSLPDPEVAKRVRDSSATVYGRCREPVERGIRRRMIEGPGSLEPIVFGRIAVRDGMLVDVG